MANKWFAWSNITNGGTTKQVKDALGRTRHVVVKRSVIEFGNAVTKSKSGLSDVEWDRMIEIGSIRDYAPPKTIPDDISPAQHVTNELLAGRLELDPNTLVELALNPGLAAPDDEEAEAEAVPEGA